MCFVSCKMLTCMSAQCLKLSVWGWYQPSRQKKQKCWHCMLFKTTDMWNLYISYMSYQRKLKLFQTQTKWFWCLRLTRTIAQGCWITQDKVFFYLFFFFFFFFKLCNMSSSGAAVQQNAGTLFYCEAPQMLSGVRNYIVLSICVRVSG